MVSLNVWVIVNWLKRNRDLLHPAGTSLKSDKCDKSENFVSHCGQGRHFL